MAKKRYNARRPAATAPADANHNTCYGSAGPVLGSESAPFFLMGGNGYQAADNSPARGYIYWPELSTRHQMTQLTRLEILRRIQWLYAHFGFCRRLVNGMARLLGYVIPQPNTSDEEWNELAYAAIMGVMGNALIWDIQGKFDGLIGQVQDNVSIFRDGFCLAVMTETESGRARLAYYEAHQLRNAPATGENPLGKWVDGVLVSKFGAHLAYSLQDSEDPSRYTQVDARDTIYFGAFENRGQVHSMSILSTAVLNMIDVVQTRGFTKQGLKSHARIGTVVEQDLAQVIAPTGGTGITGAILQTYAPGNTAATPTPEVINWETVYSGGLTPNLKPGQRVKVVADGRPTQNAQDFERALLRDCAWACDLSYETLCDVSGITGPGIRFLTAELKRWIKLRRYPQIKRAHRLTSWLLAKELKTSRLRAPRLLPGEMWWNQLEYIGLADMDIDGGRTSAATVTDLRTGLTTYMDEWGNRGAGWKKRIKQAITESVLIALECAAQGRAAGLPDGTITPERVFPDRFTLPAPAQPVDPDQVNKDPESRDAGDELEPGPDQ